jgi:hypothetical protein
MAPKSPAMSASHFKQRVRVPRDCQEHLLKIHSQFSINLNGQLDRDSAQNGR